MIMNNLERDNLIDGFFNKGYACDLSDVYQAVTGTIKDLEKANDEKVEKIEKLNNIINELDAMFDGDLDGFFTINEKGACNDIIEVIQNYKDKLKELKGKSND